MPPQFFRELLLPRLQLVFAAFRQAGALANWLNTAGPTSRELLNVYLAVAGLFDTTLARIASERRFISMADNVPEMLYQMLRYPRGLKGDEIMLGARILCVADVVESRACRNKTLNPQCGL